MELKIPKGQRIGQAIFNFLEWLRIEKGINKSQGRMIDPFYIEDKDFNELWTEWLKWIKNNS